MILDKSLLLYSRHDDALYSNKEKTRDGERETEDNEGDYVEILNIVHDII
jgi:hypothetical protein